MPAPAIELCSSIPHSAFRIPPWGGAGGGGVRVGVDVGGTFTDLVALAEDGTIEVRKVVTTPDDPAVGLFHALDPLEPLRPIELLVHGTTIATNALLERRGARIALVTTKGFEDLLWLRRQDRAALYDLGRDHAPPLVARSDVVAVAERTGPEGVLEPLREDEVVRVVAAVRALAPTPEALAVALLFAFRHAEHERRLVAALRDALPDTPIAASHEVLPVFREFERASTTTVEAYLRPKVAAYLGRLEREVRARGVGTLRVMTSSGGTLPPGAAVPRAAWLALSGPAGGVVGARLVGAAVGLSDLLTLDMGGTSADASLVAGGAPLADSGGTVAGLALALPAVLIETVSAGGGSIARVDEGGALKVGPESAGAVPGPACYGRGGERPTVTDACLVLRWLDAQHPLADAVRLDRAAAEHALGSLGVASDPTAIAAGIVAVAAAVMARALKRVSVARGLDPRRMALLPFGGAGDAHRRDPAPSGRLVGARARLRGRARGPARLVSPPDRRSVVPGPRDGVRPAARRRTEPSARRRAAALRRLPVRGAGVRGDRAGDERRSAARRERVPGRASRAVRSRADRPGSRDCQPARGRATRGAAAAVRGRAPGRSAARRQPADHTAGDPRRRLGLGAGRSCRGRHHRRPGDPRRAERHCPDRAWVAWDRAPLRRGPDRARVTLDAVGLEVMGHAFASVAEEMGLVLIHSAVSPNIRERRDCSAALFDAAGE